MSAQDPGGEKRSLQREVGGGGAVWMLRFWGPAWLAPLLPHEDDYESCAGGGSLGAGGEGRKQGNGCPADREGQRP